MTVDDIWGSLHPSLCLLVEAELNCGNRIVSVDESRWTKGQLCLVRLEKPFSRRYDELPGINFLSVNDPHYLG